MSSMWGNSIRIQIFGESHGGGIGVVMDGMPSGEAIDLDELQAFMARRAPGQGAYSTARKEADDHYISGIYRSFHGKIFVLNHISPFYTNYITRPAFHKAGYF